MREMEPVLTSAQREALKALKARLEPFLEARGGRLRIFGSRARGDAEPHSDLDLAVLVPGLTREEKRNVLQQVAEVELETLTVFSALVMSEEDFQGLKALERRIALDIEREGVPV